METIIALLKAAIAEYEHGTIMSGDKLLNAAVKFQKEIQKAKLLVPIKLPPKTS